MNSRKVLVVDDDAHIRELIRLCLGREGFEVLSVPDGDTGLQEFYRQNVDLVILDVMLPRIDGWEVLRKIRAKKQTPVIMLTAKDEEMDKVLGLELGADDYVTKPFGPRELVARVKAVLRRSAGGAEEQVMEFSGLTIDVPRHQVRFCEREVALAPKEFDLLVYLAQREGRVVTREQILEQVWGYEYVGDARTVDEHVKRIRQKIEKVTYPMRFIRTVWGVGYKFEVWDDTQ